MKASRTGSVAGEGFASPPVATVQLLFPVLRGHDEESLWVSRLDGHPNGAGHRLLARALLDGLDRSIQSALPAPGRHSTVTVTPRSEGPEPTREGSPAFLDAGPRRDRGR